MSLNTIISIILIATILLWLVFGLIKKLFGCPNCGSLRKQKYLGMDSYDPYPKVECKKCGQIYFTYN